MGAGLGTGFAGMSAAAVISPMLIAFFENGSLYGSRYCFVIRCPCQCGFSLYLWKNKNLDIRNGLLMMVSVLIFTVVGSYAASLLPSSTMGSFSVFYDFYF